jgi:hypothetical protein
MESAMLAEISPFILALFNFFSQNGNIFGSLSLTLQSKLQKKIAAHFKQV